MILLLLPAILSACLSVNANSTLVHVEQGLLRGGTRFGIRFFDRIPFAQSPVGELRFKPPQPPLTWQGTRDATYTGKRCYQIGASNADSSEDCLQLNVFAPMNITKPLPVAVWIHGGGYQQGSAINANGTSIVLGSNSTMIVVTINYRLNVFGFLGNDAMRSRDPERHSTGNYGLQDQRAALAWVSRNIAQFGGDPSRIGIFGESAGAQSVTCHVTSPASWPYFNAAIAESGSFGVLSAQSLSYSETVYNQTLSLSGCADFDCLLQADPALLVSKLVSLSLHVPFVSAYLPWAPTVDGVEFQQNPFLLARSGHVHPSARILHGFNRDEGSTFSYPLKHDMTQDDLRTFLSASYGTKMVEPLLEAYANQTYPSVNSSNTQWYWQAERTITDHQFACPTILATQWLTANNSQQGTGPGSIPTQGQAREVYQYYFTDATYHTPFVGHGDEVPYVFNKWWMFTSTEQQTLAYQFNDWWRTFIAGSAPTSARCSTPLAWPQGDGNRTFAIANGCDQAVILDLKVKECSVWRDYLIESTTQ
eukprot:m.93842 g.93842  ORF g.93842 m.93842 type:complete len:535 (-) comp14993_c0_seq1:40-1644(-)